MNRRDFTKSLMAASVTPALPMSALAKVAPAATLARDPMYIWASFLTRVHSKSSPAMLSRLLKLDADRSTQLYTQLLKDGALTAPDAFGLSQSTNPLYPEYAKVTGHGKTLTEGLTESRRGDVKDVLADDDQVDEEEPVEGTETEVLPETDPQDEEIGEGFTRS